MFKRFIILWITTMFLASTASADDFSFTAGVKAWYTDWGTTALANHVTSNYALLVGPSLRAGYGNLFAGASYLRRAGNDYTLQNNGSTQNGSDAEIAANRKDLDGIVGYMLHPRLGIFVGYKDISSDLNYRRSTSNVINGTYDIKGPAVGLTMNYPFQSFPVSVYLNGAYMKLKGDIAWNTQMPPAPPAGNLNGTFDYNEKMTGYMAEFGASYAFLDHYSVNVGYKYQRMSWNQSVNSRSGQPNGIGAEEFTGGTLGVNYTF